ncbi:MAG: hypothetical protein MH204_05255 [Fimbriimonadaceae bacterium]|nr:hypothetical protein [Fimbriimonadaceae bacterium]
MGKVRTKDFRNTTAWLDQVTTRATKLKMMSASAALWAAGAWFATGILGTLGVGVAVALGAAFSGGIAILLLFGVWLAALGAAFAVWRIFSKRQASPEERARIDRLFGAARHLKELKDENKLHKNLDPMVLQALEAAAYHWGVIRDLSGGGGSEQGLRAGLKRQAREAAEEAMEEATLMAAQCTGKPEKSRKDLAEDVLEDFLEFDIKDALKGLSRLAASSSADFAYRSPAGRAVFEEIRGIAERLQALSAELTRESGGSVATASAPTRSLDTVLAELKAVREAEQELEGEERINT